MTAFLNTADRLRDKKACAQFLMRTLTEFKDDQLNSIAENSFLNCANLRIVDVPRVVSIEARAFHRCATLDTLILRNVDQVCKLKGAGLTATLIASGTGYIYVPAALVEDYKAATNWSTYAAQFRALEDYTVDGTTTGELDLEKMGVTS